MATREENLKKINAELEKLNDDELDQVAGGSAFVTEKEAKQCGLTLKKSDGSPGSFGYLWNTGDYYWKGAKIDDDDAHKIVDFFKKENRLPNDVLEVREYYKPKYRRRRGR